MQNILTNCESLFACSCVDDEPDDESEDRLVDWSEEEVDDNADDEAKDRLVDSSEEEVDEHKSVTDLFIAA